MTLLAFWPQYVRDLKCLQPSKYEFNKYVNQSMFIYSLAELKSPDSSQKHSVTSSGLTPLYLKHQEINTDKKNI